MFFLIEILILTAALSITSASTIEGHNIVHEENCDEKWKKCAPPPDQNVYVTTSSMLLMREPEVVEDEECSANMVIFCPACKEEGIIERCKKLDPDGYCYIIDHALAKCVILEQHERDQVLEQIKHQRAPIRDICLRYFTCLDQGILDEMGLEFEDI